MSNSEIKKRKIGEVLPVMPLKGDTVVFPYMIIPLFVATDKSIRALEQAMLGDHLILLVSQKDASVEQVEESDLHSVGTVAECMQMLKLPDGTVRVVAEGLARMRITRYVQTDPFFQAQVEEIAEPTVEGVEIEALMRNTLSQFERVIQLGKSIPPEALISATNVDEAGRLADLIASYLNLKGDDKQRILETPCPQERLEQLSILLAKETEILEIDKEIETRVRKEVGDTQKEYILRERLKAIQEELGSQDGFSQEIAELKKQVEENQLAEEAKEKALKEIDRLEKMPPVAPEASVIRTYLDWLIELPWDKRTKDNLNIQRAERILDEDHYGLKKMKERVVEFLAVRKLTDTAKGPILCFIGPPGVGKTSIGKSIARSMGRKFIRLSLGGVRDEAEIRGHRRTYIGSMPGRILQTLRRAGSKNPVFMIDEIDKIGVDFRGDPSAALLEVLDPEQNDAFSDHYLEVPFDLSEVMFVTTGNLLDPIPSALKDRMEVIDFPGYIDEEKLHIAKEFLLPKQLTAHGLKSRHLAITDTALHTLICQYTREAGVRNLERELAALCRKTAKQVAEGRKSKTHITIQNLHKFLGPPKFHHGVKEEKDEIAVATGLAVTQAGGDVLSIEVSVVDGKGNLTLTGQLGDVMQESAKAALTYVRSRAALLKADKRFYEKKDLHIHVPSGAVPKDGPSAGISISTALASAVSLKPVRRDVAMTGEVTLRGKVLPVGGIKEKILAAHRAGLMEVILPKENEKDLEDIPSNVRNELVLHFVKTMDEVLKIALVEEQ